MFESAVEKEQILAEVVCHVGIKDTRALYFFCVPGHPDLCRGQQVIDLSIENC